MARTKSSSSNGNTGKLIDRVHRELTDKDMAKITGTHHWRTLFMAELEKQFEESAKREQPIRQNLKGMGYMQPSMPPWSMPTGRSRRIVEEEQGGAARAEYGTRLIRTLSRDLADEFGKGLSVANLWNFWQFYLTFPDAGKSYALRSQLSWTHWRLIMRVENLNAREYYIEETARQQWSSRSLERAIETHAYQRLLKAPEATPTIAPPPDPLHFIKDPYILEFLNLPEHPGPCERVLEDALIARLRDFLMELGKGFSFVGRQLRISTETTHFYVDLVFYNYLLKCFVLIDLKTKKLTHENIGQMDMYVRMFDDLKRGEGDNPTLGIILCADKDETLVRYSVLSESQQLFASKYRLVLPSEEELAAELDRRHVFELPGDGDES